MKIRKQISRIISTAGSKVLYSALLLYYAFKRNDLPVWAKSIVIGVIGYLITPFDSIPDLTPILGYTDDLGLLSYALVMIAAYINNDVRKQAKERLTKWLKTNVDEKSIRSVEKYL